MNVTIYQLSLWALLGMILASCQTSRRSGSGPTDNFTYFQPESPTADSVATAIKDQYVFRLAPGDIIAINVSSLSKEADAQFNPFVGSSLTVGSTSGENNLPIGYRVSEDGTINFPKLGRIKVVDLTTTELERRLSEQLLTSLREPYVTVRLLNFKVSVLGEVAKPSVFTVQNERITLTEALSLAGDLTQFGQREDVLVVREMAGQRTFGRVDLRSRTLFSSPYYYLKPNDVIYIATRKSKKLLAGNFFPWLPTIVSGVTLLVFTYANIIRR
ncbi:polysaccharide biosynthesis/export family protein [Nibrella saemangeumensis]|uniref:Polysaccharide biosynthesis/export family protein n=1 Tax=Nibrella saemangeumensis TaxID=1084526 RepID=A0ABP8MZY1_9BACT